MFEHLFDLPTLSESVQRIADALVSERHSVIVVVPAPICVDLVGSRIYREFLPREPRVRRVVVRDVEDPLKIIAESEGVQYQGKLTIKKLLSEMEKQLPPDERSAILHIVKLEDTSPKTQQVWLQIFVQWAEAAQTRSAERLMTPALLLIMDARQFPQDFSSRNVFLQIFWFGQLSSLEVQLLCRLQADSEADSCLATWREQVLPDLVGTDLNLLEQLWEPIAYIRSVDNLTTHLREYAAGLGWEETADLETAFHLPSARYVENLSASQRNLWARGMLYYTPENGWEFHSALLALMNRQREISHRYWRGQARLILPFIDHVRHSILSVLAKRYGKEWPSQWISPIHNPELEAPIQDVSQVEWGHLKHLFESSVYLDGERKWRGLIRLGWNIRNKIAHYEPVTLADYRALRQEYERFVEEYL
jgi:hypothetical protein